MKVHGFLLQSLTCGTERMLREEHCLCFNMLTSRHDHAVLIGCYCVDDRIVSGQVLYKLSIRKLPLLEVIRRARHHTVPETQHKLQSALTSFASYNNIYHFETVKIVNSHCKIVKAQGIKRSSAVQ